MTTWEPIATQSRPATIRSFRYPEAPWDTAATPAREMFREIAGSETLSAVADPREREESVPFEYRSEPGFDFEPDADLEPSDADAGVADAGTGQQSETIPDEERHFQELLRAESLRAEERGRSLGFDAGRELGLAEGREDGRESAARQFQAEAEGQRQRLTSQTGALLKSFAEARESYCHRLEQESVRLALAIAAWILRRETQADPLLLTGAVRVALGQLAASTLVRLRVPAADLALWQETMAHLPNLAVRPEVIGDSSLESGDCRLETELGSADLGLGPQLEAIERQLLASSETESGAVDRSLPRPGGPDAAERHL